MVGEDDDDAVQCARENSRVVAFPEKKYAKWIDRPSRLNSFCIGI